MVNLSEMANYRDWEEKQLSTRNAVNKNYIPRYKNQEIYIKQEGEIKEICPHCKNEMKLRYGRYGYFMYCTGVYCRYTRSIKQKHNYIETFEVYADNHGWYGEWLMY